MISVSGRKKGDVVEKQQYINECHLEVNPTFVHEQAGNLRERFDMAVHRNQLMELFRMYL